MNKITFESYSDIPHQTSWGITNLTEEISDILIDQNSLNNKITNIYNLVFKAVVRPDLKSIHAILNEHLEGYKKFNLDTIEKLTEFVEPLFDQIREFAQTRRRFKTLETACALSTNSFQIPLFRLIPRIIQTQKINLNEVHSGCILELGMNEDWHLNLLSRACDLGNSIIISIFLQNGADVNYGLYTPRAMLPPALFINLCAYHLEPTRKKSINTMLLKANATALVTYTDSETLLPRWWLAHPTVIEHCCKVDVRSIIASIPDYSLAFYQKSHVKTVTVLDDIFNNTIFRNRFQITEAFFSQVSELVTVLVHHGIYLSSVLPKLKNLTGRASPIDDKVRKLSKIVEDESGIRKLALGEVSRKKVIPILSDVLGFMPKVLLHLTAEYYTMDNAIITNPLIREIAEHCIPHSNKLKKRQEEIQKLMFPAKLTSSNNVS